MDWLLPLLYILILIAVPWVLLAGKRERIYHLVATLYILVGIFLLISLISYRPSAQPYQNWGGFVGHYSGAALYGSVGLITGLALVCLSFVVGGLHFAKRLSLGNLLRGFGVLAAFICITSMFPSTGGTVQKGLSGWLAGLLGWGRFLLLGFLFFAFLWPFWWLVRPVKEGMARLFSRIRWPNTRNRRGSTTEIFEIKPRPSDRIESRIVKAEKPADAPQNEPEEETETILGTVWDAPPEEKPEQTEPSYYSGQNLDPITLLSLFNEPPAVKEMDDSEAKRIAGLITERLKEFGVEGKIVDYKKGPVVTRYEYEPAPGIKLSRVVGLADDLALRIKALSVRMVAPLPGKGLIGIEVPNPKRRVVYFRELAEREEFLRASDPLTFALGVDPGGEPKYESLSRMPHLLIAGTTGSGKSVCINTILSCFLMAYRHRDMRLILVDPKRVELSFYEGVPHLLMPVIKDRKQAGEALKKAVAWMEIRYRHFAREGVRDIESHNRTAPSRGDDPIPYIVIVIDEFSDLMLTMGKEVEEPLARLAQMARAVGIHLVVATQRPSVDVITGIIKANFPVRIAFKVPSRVDSRTILDEMGAEKLLGKGDMLFIPPGSAEPTRLHGPFVSEEETTRLASALTLDYLNHRLGEAFGKISEVYDWAAWIVNEGLTPALTREDEPGAEDRLSMIAERGARVLGKNQEDITEELLNIRNTYYMPIEEMEEAPIETLSEEGVTISGELDPLLPEAARLIVSRGQGSATMLQRKIKVGFARAARIMDQLEELGIVEPGEGTKSRRPIISLEELEAKLRSLGL
ncbi:MAG: DNA translocase FtsK [candidate division WOR-3 bacterium]